MVRVVVQAAMAGMTATDRGDCPTAICACSLHQALRDGEVAFGRLFDSAAFRAIRPECDRRAGRCGAIACVAKDSPATTATDASSVARLLHTPIRNPVHQLVGGITDVGGSQ
jgi:hypothetical protein